jgi:NADP-dependent 3-hydroxy acid dehydrogenase YdfG
VHQAERSKKHLILLLDIEITKCRHGSGWRTAMSLENKNAIIYGAGGAVGGAVARAFAREGARVFLTGRDLSTIDALAKEISAAGGVAETAQVDALDEEAVGSHLDAV